jgi:hypothetical protein
MVNSTRWPSKRVRRTSVGGPGAHPAEFLATAQVRHVEDQAGGLLLVIEAHQAYPGPTHHDCRAVNDGLATTAPLRPPTERVSRRPVPGRAAEFTRKVGHPTQARGQTARLGTPGKPVLLASACLAQWQGPSGPNVFSGRR